ncbi:hypothetical protein EJB05_02858, partial [Eragrostis curvula]
MEAHYPKYALYSLLILGSSTSRSPPPWPLPAALDAKGFLPPPAVEAEDRRRASSLSSSSPPQPSSSPPPPSLPPPPPSSSSPSASLSQPPPPSPSCEGRYVYMLDVPELFNMPKDCVEGSPLFDDIWSWCAITVNG